MFIKGDGDGVAFDVGLDSCDAFDGFDDIPYRLRGARSPAVHDFQFNRFLCRRCLLLKSCQDGHQHDQNKQDDVSCFQGNPPFPVYLSIKDFTGAAQKENRVKFPLLAKKHLNHDSIAFLIKKNPPDNAAITAAIPRRISGVSDKMKHGDLGL